MKTLSWDTGNPLDCFDNPNCRWGSPSYRLEAGDPGYVEWFPPGYQPPDTKPKSAFIAKAPLPNNLPIMPETYQYITRPTSAGNATTTQPVYRGTKTKPQLITEIQSRLGANPVTVEAVLRTHHEVVIDWTTQGWKIDTFDDLIGFRLTVGGSAPTGEPEDWSYDAMNADLNCHTGNAGETRSRAIFASEKVGEQARSAPVFVEVFDSETKEANHYQAGKGLTVRFSNRKFEFDTPGGCKMRFRKADNTIVDAAGYPYVKGNTVVCTPPAGLSGTVFVIGCALINGTLRTAEYPFPLT
jgi:hypothetical protein